MRRIGDILPEIMDEIARRAELVRTGGPAAAEALAREPYPWEADDEQVPPPERPAGA